MTFQPDGGHVTARWTDAGIPQVGCFDGEEVGEFPDTPREMLPNDLRLITALRDAADTADREATRYALGHLRLRGPGGQIAATDGRQALVQARFAFPWEDELLVPACRAFAAGEFTSAESVAVGRTDDWVSVRSGAWTLHLRIEKDAKFPQVDDHVPNPSQAVTTLHLSDPDAEFLTRAVGRLPGSSELNSPVTVDLNGEVAIRAKGEDQNVPTELVLAGSGDAGEPLRLNTNRKFLARALSLGFRQLHLYGPEAPACCQDGHRSYVWAVLGQEGVIQAEENMTRIGSPAHEGQVDSTTSDPRRSNTTMPRTNSTTNGRVKNSHATNGEGHDDSTNSASLLDQAESLKEMLTDALSQTRGLIVAIKKQQKQTRLMRSTLRSLKELQTIDA